MCQLIGWLQFQNVIEYVVLFYRLKYSLKFVAVYFILVHMQIDIEMPLHAGV